MNAHTITPAHPLTAILSRAFATSDAAIRAASGGKWGLADLERHMAKHMREARKAEVRALPCDVIRKEVPQAPQFANRQSVVLQLLRDGAPRTTAQIAKHMGLKPDHIRDDLARLVGLGLVKKWQPVRGAPITYQADKARAASNTQDPRALLADEQRYKIHYAAAIDAIAAFGHGAQRQHLPATITDSNMKTMRGRGLILCEGRAQCARWHVTEAGFRFADKWRVPA